MAPKRKTTKDPDAPKRAGSAWTLYLSDQMNAFKAANPDTPHKEVMGRISAQWKEESESVRAAYEAKADAAKAKYQQQKATYDANKGSDSSSSSDDSGSDSESGSDSGSDAPKKKGKGKKRAKAGKKAKKDPNAPKRAASAYLLFCNAKRQSVKEANPNAAPKDLLGLLAEEWQKATPSDKAPFEKAAAQDKLRYEREMGDYNA